MESFDNDIFYNMQFFFFPQLHYFLLNRFRDIREKKIEICLKKIVL